MFKALKRMQNIAFQAWASVVNDQTFKYLRQFPSFSRGSSSQNGVDVLKEILQYKFVYSKV